MFEEFDRVPLGSELLDRALNGADLPIRGELDSKAWKAIEETVQSNIAAMKKAGFNLGHLETHIGAFAGLFKKALDRNPSNGKWSQSDYETYRGTLFIQLRRYAIVRKAAQGAMSPEK